MAKNVIIGQSGGPTAVINSSLAGVYKAACSLGADKVYGMKYGIEGLLKEELIELNVLLDDRMSIELLKRTPSSYLGSCRFKLPDPDTDSTPFVKLFTLFDKYDICAVFYIGGNDSMDTIAKLSRYGDQVGSSVRFIGVPKTIDNDLCLTDHTPGYGSAAKYIATILKEVIRDSSVYDIRSVTVAEIMGRHAGWLAGAACMAAGPDCDGPDMILLPGTKSTIADLRWLRQSGLEAAILKAADAGTLVFGICGGYQMLGRTVSDPEQVEAAGVTEINGLGLLEMDTEFRGEKVQTQTQGVFHGVEGMLSGLNGLAYEGYEIHMGRSQQQMPALTGSRNVYGSYVHGIFDAPGIADTILKALCARKGVSFDALATFDACGYKERQYDLLADVVRGGLDMSFVYRVLRREV